jgi:hypothetical protein
MNPPQDNLNKLTFVFFMIIITLVFLVWKVFKLEDFSDLDSSEKVVKALCVEVVCLDETCLDLPYPHRALVIIEKSKYKNSHAVRVESSPTICR